MTVVNVVSAQEAFETLTGRDLYDTFVQMNAQRLFTEDRLTGIDPDTYEAFEDDPWSFSWVTEAWQEGKITADQYEVLCG